MFKSEINSRIVLLVQILYSDINRKLPNLFLALVCLVYIYIVLNNLVNVPYQRDDVVIYLHQFQQKYILSQGLNDFIHYLFDVTLWPHPRLVGTRVLSLASYYLLGSVDFRFILIVSHLPAFIIIYVLNSFIRYRSSLTMLLLSLLFLVPIVNTVYWSAALSGYMFDLLFITLTFFCMRRGYHRWASMFAFLEVFAMGSGFLIIPAIILYFYSRDRTNIRSHYLPYAISFILSLVLLFYVTFEQDYSTSMDQKDLGSFNVLICIVYAISAMGSGFVTFLSPDFNLYLSLVLGATMTVSMTFFTSFRRFTGENLEIVWIFGYIFLILLIASIMRSDPSGRLIQPVLPRYGIYSLYIISLFLVALLNFVNLYSDRYKKRYQYVLLILLCCIYIPRIITVQGKHDFLQSNLKSRYVALFKDREFGIGNFLNVGLLKFNTSIYSERVEVRSWNVAEGSPDNQLVFEEEIYDSLYVLKGVFNFKSLGLTRSNMEIGYVPSVVESNYYKGIIVGPDLVLGQNYPSKEMFHNRFSFGFRFYLPEACSKLEGMIIVKDKTKDQIFAVKLNSIEKG